MSVTPIIIQLTRGANDHWTQSYNVWAKTGGMPQTDGDGVFVGTIAIGTNAISAGISWTPPANGTYQFLAVPVRFDVSGLPARLPL